MDGQHWERIQSLFHQAAEMPREEQRSFLELECRDDTEAFNEVLALLAEDARRTSVLDGQLGEIARTLIHDSSEFVFARVGPYRILRLLGRGGMGLVYLADRQDLGNQVAIKILPHAWMSGERRERFALEARTLSRLNHPNIARLYDAGTLDDGTPWFAMEYVDGLSLTEYCDRHQLNVPERLRLFRAVCEAVRFAHSQAVLHRDLKPSNILVGAGGEVRLLDFGIAKQLEQMHATDDVTLTALRLATPAYASPEQLRGEPAAIQSDVYSLGAILSELLGPDRTQSSDLHVVCSTAMHPEVPRRYQSSEALIRDIDHFLNTEPLEARPDDVGYKVRRFVSRNVRVIVAASLVLAAFTALAVFFTLRLTAARDAALAEAARTQRVRQFMLHLFDGGDRDSGPSSELKVVTLVDRSAQQVRALNTDPSVQADLCHTIGVIYHNLGKLDRAGEFLSQSLAIRQRMPKHSDAGIVESLVSLGTLRVDQAKFDEAEKLIPEGLNHAKRTLSRDDPAIPNAMSAWGRALESRGKYQEAIRVLEEAARMQSVTESPGQEQAYTMMRLAGVHFYLSHFEESKRITTEVLEIYRRMYGDTHPQFADPLFNLASIAQEQARFGEAEELFRRALAVNRAYYGNTHVEVAACLRGLGSALVSQHRLKEAEPVLEEALVLREGAYGRMHPNVASAVGSLADVALGQGKLDRAEQLYSRMVNIYRTVYHDRHKHIGIAMGNLASVALVRKNFSGAEGILRDALRRLQETTPPDHIDIGVVRVKLGRALLGQGRYREAEEESTRGLAVLLKSTAPTSPHVVKARQDLASIYRHLGQPVEAAKYQ